LHRIPILPTFVKAMDKQDDISQMSDQLFEDIFLYGHYIIKTDKDGVIERIDPRRREEILLSQSTSNG